MMIRSFRAGGGKTHTLITLRHMVADPDNLPDLPAVDEFKQAIGQAPPQARVAGLCFDKLDVEKGMEVRGPDGKKRVLRQPWSVLAYQIAGDAGLKILYADDKAEERDSAPAENLLTELLEVPVKDGMGVLILIDEVLMYVREKVGQATGRRDRMINFFQYLTQAATKVDRCCIVASLLARKERQPRPSSAGRSVRHLPASARGGRRAGRKGRRGRSLASSLLHGGVHQTQGLIPSARSGCVEGCVRHR